MGKVWGRFGKASKAATEPVVETAAPAIDELQPTSQTDLILANIALRGGDVLLRKGIARGLLGAGAAAQKTGKITKGGSLAGGLIGTALTRIATRSVPGAIIVGSGLLAKSLYDRRKDKAARQEGEAQEP